jgi:hypothetical protein
VSDKAAAYGDVYPQYVEGTLFFDIRFMNCHAQWLKNAADQAGSST